MSDPKKEKDELEGVETISREQAEKEMQEAARKVQGQQKPSSKASDDEMEDVEVIPREQAEKEMREAVRKVQNQQKKSQA